MFRDHNQRSDRTGGRARRQRCHSRRRRSSADGGTTRSRVAPSPVPSPHALTGHEPTACSGVRAPGCRPCAHEPLVTRPAGGGPPTQGRDLRRAASGFQIGTSTVHRYVREAIKLLAATAPTLAHDRGRARKGPRCTGRTRQPLQPHGSHLSQRARAQQRHLAMHNLSTLGKKVSTGPRTRPMKPLQSGHIPATSLFGAKLASL